MELLICVTQNNQLLVKEADTGYIFPDQLDKLDLLARKTAFSIPQPDPLFDVQLDSIANTNFYWVNLELKEEEIPTGFKLLDLNDEIYSRINMPQNLARGILHYGIKAVTEWQYNLKFDDLPFRQATHVLVINSDSQKILIVTKPEWQAGSWSFPGGGLEPTDNSAIEGAVREVKEEVGITDLANMTKSKYLDEFVWPAIVVRNRGINKKTWLQGQQKQIFIAYTQVAEPTLDRRELSDYKWVKPSELHKHLSFLGQAEFFNQVLQEFNLI